MDSVMKTTLCLFIVLLASFTGFLAYHAYVDFSYRDTITGKYSYSFSITTDAPLSNVTLFLPVPADGKGNSPIVSAYSNHTVTGVPAGWKTTLYDTGKTTMVKVETGAIIPASGAPASGPYTVTFTAETSDRAAIETKDPGARGVMFHPVQDLRTGACPQGYADGSAPCISYNTSLFAGYDTAADTNVMITSVLTGKNTWTIFEPHSNEFRADMSTMLRGPNRGWKDVAGTLSAGRGDYDPPFGI